MKPFLAVVAGFVVGLGIFTGGVVFATVLLTAEPQHGPGPSVDVADLWASEPRRIDTASQELERIAAAPKAEATQEPDRTADWRQETPNQVDATTTASVDSTDPDEASIQDEFATEVIAAHVGWCSKRYRSYRVSDDSYQPYSGGRRACVSPFSHDVDALAELMSTDGPDEGYLSAELDGTFVYAMDEGEGAPILDPQHVQDCFNRYRSYRPEDNTYQPYGGGPRKQCR